MPNEIEQITNKILHAHKSKEPIDFIRKEYTIDEQTAYQVQDYFVKKKCEFYHEDVSGYKISMTSPDTQALANIYGPAYGTLTSGNLLNTQDTVSLSTMFDSLVEPELIFIITEDLTICATEDEILSKSKIAAGLEIPDSRYRNWFPNFSLTDLLCDNGVTGRVVISEAVMPPSFKVLSDIKMNLLHNGSKIDERISSNVLGNPVSSVTWLTEKLAVLDLNIKKGMIISSGTFISPKRVKEGTYKAIYTGIGEVDVTFTP